MLNTRTITSRRLIKTSALIAAIWCGQAHAQVLEQVPADAFAVLKIKDLEATSKKTADLAKKFGADEFVPELKDPLAALLDQGKMEKGFNKSGEAALIIYAPKKVDGSEQPDVLGLMPVSDYKVFLSNFDKADKPSGVEGVAAVKDPTNGGTMYVAHRGSYAVIGDKTDHMIAKGGLKISKAVQHEADEKDAVLIINTAAVRDFVVPAIKDHRKEIIEEMDKAIAEEAEAKPFIPVLDTFVNLSFDKALEFAEQTQGIAFSLSITDKGILGGELVEFAPDSNVGKAIAALKPGSMPLLAGLPDGKYFFVGGASIDHKAISTIADAWVDPITKSLKETNTDIGTKVAKAVEIAKTAIASTDHTVAGMPVPTKAIGQDSLFQQITVVYGDSKAISLAEKSLLDSSTDLMGLVPDKGPLKTKIVRGKPKAFDGVSLETYTTNFDFDKNDPQALQAQQIMSVMYGANGVTGSYGAIDDKTFIQTQGASDELIKELVASAKSGKDVLSQSSAVKAVAAQFPADRSVVYYVFLDNVVSTTLKYAAGLGIPIKLKLPENLPPIGVAGGVDGSSARLDLVIPIDTIQALVSAALKAQQDMQGGKGGGL